MNPDVDYGQSVLDKGIRSTYIDNGNGLKVHLLEAGDRSQPCILFLHGFPELAFSWRKILLPIAQLGYHVLAPDQRGYGLTTGWDPEYDGNLASFRIKNLVIDVVGTLDALGHTQVSALVGHDFGSPVAAWAALMKPETFRASALMSSPFGGAGGPAKTTFGPTIHDDLAALSPSRKHYQWYYSTREANENLWHCPQGVHDFLRAYYHFKSADWKPNQPYPLRSWTANQLAKLPKYYVMNLEEGMAETVAPQMPPESEIARCPWLTDAELAVYSEQFGRIGFQGGLQWYRCATSDGSTSDLADYAGKTIDVPTTYVAGKSDWGTFQRPGAFEHMKSEACTDFRGAHLVERAGHWVQQEQPEKVIHHLKEFLQSL